MVYSFLFFLIVLFLVHIDFIQLRVRNILSITYDSPACDCGPSRLDCPPVQASAQASQCPLCQACSEGGGRRAPQCRDLALDCHAATNQTVSPVLRLPQYPKASKCPLVPHSAYPDIGKNCD